MAGSSPLSFASLRFKKCRPFCPLPGTGPSQLSRVLRRIPLSPEHRHTEIKPGATTLIVNAINGTYEGNSWSISGSPKPGVPGTTISVDVGPTQELVAVKQIVPLPSGQFALALMTPFANGHAEGSLMILNAISGNPGPQPNYNPLQDTAVVRYYSVIN